MDAFYFLRSLNWNDVAYLNNITVDDLDTLPSIFEGFYDSLVQHCRHYRAHPEKSEPTLALALRAMLEKNLKDYVAAPFRTRIHEEWYLSASENEKLKATRLVWTPGTKLPPVDPEPQVAHASSPRQGQKRAQSASEMTGDKDKECQGAHKKHKTGDEGGTSHHKGAEESLNHALQRDASNVSFRPVRPERPLTPPEINNIPSATPISHALRPISFDPLSSSRRMYSYQEKVSMGAALASHDCLQEPAVTGDLSVLSHTNFITRGKTLVKDMEYDQSHKLVCTQCAVRGLKCTEAVEVLGKDTRKCHNCYTSHAAIPCSLREPGCAQFQQVQAEYLAGYTKGNFRELKQLSWRLRDHLEMCNDALHACEMSWEAVECALKMHSSAISKVISRSQAEVDFVTETLPTLGYIVNAIIKSAEDASSLKGDSIPQEPQMQAGVSKTPFIDAGKLFVQKLFDPVPCSACVLEKLHLRGTVANLRALEGACFHEEPPSRFEHVGKQCMKEQVTDTEIQQSLEGVLSLLTLYSQEVIRHRQTRAALDESMSIFTDRVTAVALRSAEELDFVMERVPFVGWIVDTAGKMRHEYPVQVDVLSVGLGELN